MRKTIAVLLSLPYTTGIGFDAWKHEIVNWIPKEENNPDINKRRPLMYYEVMRKMCMGVTKGEVIKVWHGNGLIDKDNYAFLQGLSTTEPLLIKTLVREDAKYWGKINMYNGHILLQSL